MGKLISVLLIFLSNLVIAQQYNTAINSELVYEDDYGTFIVKNKTEAEKLTIEWLNKNPNFDNHKGKLSFLSERATNHVIHYRFQLIVNDIPIVGGQVKVCTNLEGDLISIAGSNYNFIEVGEVFNNSDAYLLQNGVLIAVSTEKELSENGLLNITSYQTLEGETLMSHDHNRYKSDTTAYVQVFYPEPITSAKTTYGTPFVDGNDAINPKLLEEHFIKKIPLGFRNDSFRLENEYFKMNEHSLPKEPLWAGTKDSILFNRSEMYFEQINVFYHLSRFRLHMDSLGYSSLGKSQIDIDAHGFSGADASVYSNSTTPARLTFGQGGVDDAEDPGIVVHEYTHALTDFAAPNSNLGVERIAIDEGISDYIALSYIREISNYRSQDIFKWDGHNEFWDGRKINPTQHYPEDINGTPHKAGGLLTVILLDISNKIGRNNTDKLAFELMYDFMPKLTFTQVAQLLVKTEKTLYNEKYKREVCDALWNHGLVDACYVGLNESKTTALELIVIDSEKFAKREGALHIVLPTKRKVSYEILNTSGQILTQDESEYGELRLFPIEFKSGIYFVRFPNSIYKTLKVVVY